MSPSNGGIYLDYAASHPLLKEAKAEMQKAWKNPANMQSSHKAGIKAARYKYDLEESIASYYRDKTGSEIHPDQVIITTSGSRANNMIVETVPLLSNNTIPVLVPFFSHSSSNHISFKEETITLGHKSFTDTYAPISDTSKKLEDVWALYMHTSVTSIDGVAVKPPQCKGWLHVDDTQGFMKDLSPLEEWNSISLSFHKIGGPQGIGALIVKNPKYATLIRSAYNTFTENAFLAAGALGAMNNFSKYQTEEQTSQYAKWFLKFYAAEFESNFKWRILSGKDKSCNNTTIALSVKRPRSATPGINWAVAELGNKGFMVSGGTACVKELSSDIVEFFQMDKHREDLVRISFGCYTKDTEIDKIIKTLNSLDNS